MSQEILKQLFTENNNCLSHTTYLSMKKFETPIKFDDNSMNNVTVLNKNNAITVVIENPNKTTIYNFKKIGDEFLPIFISSKSNDSNLNISYEYTKNQDNKLTCIKKDSYEKPYSDGTVDVATCKTVMNNSTQSPCIQSFDFEAKFKEKKQGGLRTVYVKDTIDFTNSKIVKRKFNTIFSGTTHTATLTYSKSGKIKSKIEKIKSIFTGKNSLTKSIYSKESNTYLTTIGEKSETFSINKKVKDVSPDIKTLMVKSALNNKYFSDITKPKKTNTLACTIKPKAESLGPVISHEF